MPYGCWRTESMAELTTRQRRILGSMRDGNLIWEVAGEEHCAIYDEKTKRDSVIRRKEIQQMEQAGWIRKAPNASRNRLDSWQLTEEGLSVCRPARSRANRSAAK